MKQYTEQKLTEIVCNACGKVIEVKDDIAKEDYFSAAHTFGYFSKTDGTQVGFELCEDCFRAMLRGFKVPAKEIEKTELC